MAAKVLHELHFADDLSHLEDVVGLPWRTKCLEWAATVGCIWCPDSGRW
jgi:hypothetical protein